MEMRSSLDVCCIILSLLCITTATVYQVIPDDHVIPGDYHSTDDHNHPLQYYLNNTSKYFASHNKLQFLPGEYALTDDIIIKNVKNFSLMGGATNGVISTIFTCTAPGGIVVYKSSDIIIANVVINECHLMGDYGDLNNASLLLHYSWNISIINIQLLHEPNDNIVSCTLQALNIFGSSILSNLKADCLEIYYDAINDNITDTNQLHIDNYEIDF